MKNFNILSAVALAAALFFSQGITRAHAMDLRHARAQKDLTPALQQSLQDKLSDVAEPYFNEQDDKKAKGGKYLDLQMKFEYLPTYGPHNQLTVSCKMGGVEYDLSKKDAERRDLQGPCDGRVEIPGLHVRAREREMGLGREAEVGVAGSRRRGRQADEREPRARREAQSRDRKKYADPPGCIRGGRRRSESRRPIGPVTANHPPDIRTCSTTLLCTRLWKRP